MLSSRRRQALRRFLKRTGLSLATCVLLFLLLDLIFPVHTDIRYAPLIKSRDGQVLHAFLTEDEQWRFKTELKELTPELKTAILFKEDRHFGVHFGVNPLAVLRALWNNVFQQRRTSGASTITMQVARLLQPKHRTYWNKLVEMFRATQLELHYSKDEILQLYLNLAPYGGNIQGVKAASLLYFSKSPDQLSLAELTALSIIPNRPNSLVMGRDNARIVQERNKWLLRFKAAKLFPEQTINDALAEPLAASRHAAPVGIQQLSRRLRNALPQENEITSTIDGRMQAKAEEITTGYVQSLRLRGVYNAAVLIANNKTGEVLSYIGSPEFLDSAHHGQVDGVAAQRSPGSTLKPFLYGLAYDAGLCTPKTVVNDVPINIAGYAPENYDLQFRGPVTIDDALKQSLNIPAVKTLQQLGVPRFAESLISSGFYSIYRQRKKLGLSVILGGCTVKLEELVTLFSSFANSGRAVPLSFVKTPGVPRRFDTAGAPVISPEAAFLVTNTLCDLHRPDLPNMADLARNVPRIAWKTGTSYGRKDAWAIGYNGSYTIGVWLGNFDGRGVTDLSGAATATPLLFALFNAIDANAGSDAWHLQSPAGLGFRLVCAETGLPPADFCTNQVMDYYLPGTSRSERCSHQRDVWISADGAMSYCTTCLPATGYKTVAYPNVAPDLAAFYDAGNIPYRRIPPHNPACSRTFDGQAPRITSLTQGATYLIIDKGKQQLTLQCQTANDVRQVYWYVNDRFLKATAPAEKLFFNPETTAVKVSCTDDKGRVAEVSVVVKFL